MKLAVFDFDSTLMDGETIDELATFYGVSNEVRNITILAMRGELDFYESLKSRVALLKGMKESDAIMVCESLKLIKGAREIVTELKKRDYRVVCFSGGFKFATSHFRDILGLDADFSNILHTKVGILSGEVGGEMMFSDSKGKMLLTLQKLLKVSKEDTIVVGDGANDLSMFAFASKKVAFCAKEILQKEANIIINNKDLREILNYI
ncbi:phosphoserine phosphatase SerB [Helicobacter sp. MIT 14-3879]|uniref:phosphoserine phosphatase SerB n=1 Tax=Helicobacter sp. MIT 14-3879 TaxID=2040649 RepID=UPI000E1EC265|nr:phosphoserine phosphatase SerB [Helicobacter sp. MIT 14-3879]RDU65607.1 phosphoserine phosphatase SerB [Helicobacter sp. MIT 14-3879]